MSLSDFSSFQLARLPRIEFGAGKAGTIADHAARYGRNILLITGQRSFVSTPHWAELQRRLNELKLDWEWAQVSGEPSPHWVDETVRDYREHDIDAVVGIGGGSALDAAKAVAGLLISGQSVLDHLEGVGKGLPFAGPTVPFIAVPTTAGTGSEATKNAVLSVRGAQGYKKSFRDETLVAELAIIDPDLLGSCPAQLIAANGMDAFTQLLESYVSINASPLTDGLCVTGMEAFRDGFWLAWEKTHPDNADGNARLAYASLISGITLAQAGLGSVHGLASPLGAFFPIPHGVVCGTLLAEVTAINIDALRARQPDSIALAKYAEAGRVLIGRDMADDEARTALVETLRDWVERLNIPRLGEFGMTADDVDRVVAHARGGSMKTNPLVLEDAELRRVLLARL